MHTNKLHNNPHKDINSCAYVSVIAAPIPLHLQLFGRNKKQVTEVASPAEKPHKEPKIKETPIEKYELTEGKLTFFALSGIFKKRWVNRGEILLLEITNVESSGNSISIKCNGTISHYVHKNKTESFKGLQEQILAYQSQTQETAENRRKEVALKAELAGAINAAIPVVDLCFDVLMGLNHKRINWSQIDVVVSKLASSVGFSGQTLASFSVDLSKISLSVTSQVPKDVAKDAMDVLKAIYGYFDALTPPDNLVENAINVENTKKAILAYFMVNDVLLAKFTGQKVDDKEISALENVILALVDKSVITLSLDELKAALENFETGELGLDDVRALFRVQLKPVLNIK